MQLQRRPWPIVGLLALLGISLLLVRSYQTYNQPEYGNKLPFSMVTITGDTALALHFSANLNTRITPSGAALPLSDHTLLYFFADSNEAFVLYRNTDGSKLDVQVESNMARINGAISTLMIDSTAASEKLLKGLSKEVIRNTRLVVLGDHLPETWYPALFRLAKVNPALSFIRTSLSDSSPKDSILIRGLWKTTTPEVATGNAGELPFIDLRKTRTLFLEKSDSILPIGFLEALATIPPNSTLWLDGFEEKEIAQMIEIAQPREVSIVNTPISNAAYLTKSKELHALHLEDSLADLTPLKKLPHLEWLSVETAQSPKGADAIQHLYYLHAQTDPATMQTLIQHNPNLQYLSLGRDSLAQLPDLSALSNLRALNIPAPHSMNLEPLKAYTNLKYLGAPVADSALADLQPYCPQCLVYAQGNDFWGVCLGSPLLLFLLPLWWLTIVLLRKKHSAPV